MASKRTPTSEQSAPIIRVKMLDCVAISTIHAHVQRTARMRARARRTCSPKDLRGSYWDRLSAAEFEVDESITKATDTFGYAAQCKVGNISVCVRAYVRACVCLIVFVCA